MDVKDYDVDEEVADDEEQLIMGDQIMEEYGQEEVDDSQQTHFDSISFSSIRRRGRERAPLPGEIARNEYVDSKH